MQDVPIDRLIEKTGSVYKLALLAAMRAVEIGNGSPRLVEMRADAKPVNVAMQEILDGKISYKVKEKK